MGSACSIENAQYDASKFQKSKAIMESGAEDAEKFTKLREIWVTQEAAHATQHAGETTGGDVHKKSTKDLNAHADVKAEAPHGDNEHAVEAKAAAPLSHAHDGKECRADHTNEATKDDHHTHEPTKSDNHGHDVKKDEHAHETKKDEHRAQETKKDDHAHAQEAKKDEQHSPDKKNDPPKQDEHHETKKEDHAPRADASHHKTDDHKKKDDAHAHNTKSNDGARTEISDHHADKH